MIPVFGFASCNMLGSLDDLEIEYVQTDETVISDAASAENQLGGIYPGWKTFGVSKVLLSMQDYAQAAQGAGDLIAANDAALADDYLLPFVDPYNAKMHEHLFNLYCTYPNATQSNQYSTYYKSPGTPLTALADELVGEPDDGTFSEADPQMYWDWLAEGTNEQKMLEYINAMYEEYGMPPYESVQAIIDEYIGYGLTEVEARAEVASGFIVDYAASVGKVFEVEFNGAGYDYRYLQTYDPVLVQGENGMSKYVYNDWLEAAGPSNSIFLLRMADVYYVKAEAEARQGSAHSAAARTALARVLERAGYDEAYVNGISAADLVRRIMQHRFMENFGENQDDYFDQVRAIKLEGSNFCDNPLTAAGKTLTAPVPRAARAGNNLLEQLP